MTGTSLDAIDTALVNIQADGVISLLATYTGELPGQMREQIIAVSTGSDDSLASIATLDEQLAEVYAGCVSAILENCNIKPDQIEAIGSHGQTIRHAPDEDPPYTVQLGNAAQLVELTGIQTVNDFRQRDLAAGGQGAPLAPLFHHHLFAEAGKNVIGLNLGGIANISVLSADGSISGFDTGPANTLMDQWTHKHKRQRYDEDARWALSGSTNEALLDKLLAEPWLSRPPPKSTGPELFNLRWLDNYLDGLDIDTADVQRTLCEYSAITISNAVNKHAPDCHRLVVCGGGAYNPLLMERINHYLHDCELDTSASYGIAPSWVEAAMFAWFAWRTLNNLPSNVPAVTGARHEVVLGSITRR